MSAAFRTGVLQRTALAISLAFPIIGCGGAPTAAKATPVEPAVRLAPLGNLVAAARLEWLVLVEPKTLAASPAAFDALSQLFPAARLADFEARHGAALTGFDELAVASFPGTGLVLVRGFLNAPRIEATFAARTRVTERHANGEGIVHVVAQRGSEPERLLLLGTRGASVERGRAGPQRAAELFALGRLKKARPALASEPLGSAAARLGAFPARFFVPGPFSGEWAAAGGGVLRTATALAVGARIEESSANGDARAREARLEIVLWVLGEFPKEAGAEARVGATLDRLLASNVGRLMGTEQPLEPLSVQAVDGGIRARIVLRARDVFRGAREATEASAEEIFRR